jgi:predicted amidohydrolase
MPATHVLSLLQTAPAFGAVRANLDAVEEAIRGLRADLLVLPELFATGYSFRDRAELAALAEPYPEGPTIQRLLAWSEATGGVIVAGYPERAHGGIYNAAAVVAAGRPLGSYRKVHLFGFERETFDPGEGPFSVHEHAGLRVGTMICFDWMYPEAARALALAGADVIAHPSNLVLPGWCQQAMCVRALENHVFTVTANRHGTEERAPRPPLRFTGASRIASPLGTVLADGPAEGDVLLRVEVDVALARCKRIPSGNDLFAERRPDRYAGWSS